MRASTAHGRRQAKPYGEAKEHPGYARVHGAALNRCFMGAVGDGGEGAGEADHQGGAVCSASSGW